MLFEVLEFKSNNERHRPVMQALALLKKHRKRKSPTFPADENVPRKFGSWDQNLMTEYHARYGGRGVMVYWHVEKHSVCIHSQLKACSSSEVASMIEGVIRHETQMEFQNFM